MVEVRCDLPCDKYIIASKSYLFSIGQYWYLRKKKKSLKIICPKSSWKRPEERVYDTASLWCDTLHRLRGKLSCPFPKCIRLVQSLKHNFCASRLVTCLFLFFPLRIERYSKVSVLPCKEVPHFIYKGKNVFLTQ